MDRAHRAELIARHRAGQTRSTRRSPEPAMPSSTPCRQDEGWSPRMVVHHLADSESNSYLRLRKLLAEDRPIVQGYDEASTHAGCTTTGRSMDDWLEIYAAHALEHAEQIRRVRGAD